MWKLSSLPRNTILQCGVAAVISMLLISWLRIRPLGLFFLATFGLWYYRTRCNLRIVPPPELQNKIKQICEKMRDFRQNQPTMFCFISASCLTALAIIGHLLSGSTVVLTGLVLAAILSTKYNFKIIKIEHNDFAWTDKINHDPEYDDEFLPEVDERNQFFLERAGDLASISSPTDEIINDDDEEKSDEIPSDLLIPDPIPEIHDISSDDDDNELLPIVKHEATSTGSYSKNNNNNNNENNPTTDVIEFKKSHFKRDSSLSTSSSSSEESLSKGLQFPDYTAVDGTALRRLQAPNEDEQARQDLVQFAVTTQLASKLIPNLVSGLVKWGTNQTAVAPTQADHNAVTQRQRVVTALDSSDESDFEILENEDFK